MKMQLNILTVLILSIGLIYSCGGETKKGNESDKTDGENQVNREKIITDTGSLKIAFVNVDTVSMKYKKIIDANLEGEEMKKKLEKQIRNMEINFQNYVKELEQKFDFMTRTEQAAAQKKLQDKQIYYESEKNRLTQEIMEFETKIMIGIYNNLYEFVEKYASENGYDFVLSKKFAGEFIYGNKNYDITYEVIEGLNKMYEESLDTTNTNF